MFHAVYDFRCWMLLQLWDSVIVLCFVVGYFVSILVLQSSQWGRESWLLCFVCYLVSRDCCVALPRNARGLSAVCDCGISWSHSLFFKSLLLAYWNLCVQNISTKIIIALWFKWIFLCLTLILQSTFCSEKVAFFLHPLHIFKCQASR